MFPNLSGVFYLANLWNALRNAFNLRTIPEVCITMGFPSRRARTRASNRAPGEILIEEWKGNTAEKALVSVHPERFQDVNQVALATLFIIGNEVYGSRRNLGSLTLGVQMDKQSGNLGYTADDKGKHAKTILTSVIRELGAIPEGFADIAEPAQRKQVNRQLKYKCTLCGTIVRAASTTLDVLCLHGGKPEHGKMATKFALQANGNGEVPAIQPAAAAAPAPVAQPAPTEVAAPAIKSPGRNFGMAAAAPAAA